MKTKLHYLLFSLIFVIIWPVSGQNVSLYHQYNGRFDFTFIGNTMNVAENGANDPCVILTSSSAALTLNPTDVIESAYLYWAGSGTGDFNVNLNAVPVVAQRTFALTQLGSGKPFFSSFADVTTQVVATGNGNYTLSNFDVSSFLTATDYCINGTNFAGWALVIVYKNTTLPLNQLNVYDGLETIPISSQNPPELSLSITLNSLNVIDNTDAKIGFVAWEGDRNIQVTESLYINDNLIGNPPLNPSNNAFNGTNSFTGSTTLYNMDLDVYNIQDNIDIGDSTATIRLTSGQDFVMINTVVTKLNSQLPDATVAIADVLQQCNSRKIIVNYSVSNLNSTNVLLSGTPIAIYVNGIFLQYTETTLPIPIDGSWNSSISLLIPNEIPNDFTLLFVVDDNGNGVSTTTELIETNNTFSQLFSFWLAPNTNSLPSILSCNEGLSQATFNFGNYDELVLAVATDTFAGFYENEQDAQNETNPILNPTNYTATTTPKEIFIRVESENCYAITSFLLFSRNCPPTIYNYVSANNDTYNDTFFIKGLRDIFVNFQLEIYNRWGRLIWSGNNKTDDWNGISNENFRFDNSNSPTSTYYYILNLNDPDYPKPLMGWLYFTK